MTVPHEHTEPQNEAEKNSAELITGITLYKSDG